MGTPLTFACPHCRTPLTVPAELAGVTGPCPACGQTITSPQPEPAVPAAAPEPIPAAPPPAHSWPPAPALRQGVESVSPHPVSSRPTVIDDRIPRERVAKGSPWTALLLALLLAAVLGTASWFLYQNYLNQGTTDPLSGGGLLDPVAAGSNPSPIVASPAPTPPKPAAVPVPAPASGPPRPPAETKAPDQPAPVVPAPVVPAPVVPAPVVPAPVVPAPVVPAPVVPAPVVPGPVVPGPVDPKEIVGRRPSESLLPLPEQEMVRELHTRIKALVDAKEVQDRLPLLYSETLGTEALGELLRKGALSKMPAMEYKTVIAFEGPRQGIIQYYVAVTNQAAAPDDDNRELMLHFANHGGGGFRANADSLAMQLQNQLQAFALDPAAAPLRAYIFIERAHFFSSDSETPRGHLCLNLRYGPFTPVVCQAFVDEGSPPAVDLLPLAAWGDSPKAVVVVLKHKDVAGKPAIVVDQFICANWLQAFPKAPPPNN